MCFEAQSHETSLKRLRPQIGSGLPLFTSCLEEVFSETHIHGGETLCIRTGGER
jgi:hypothetical protein